MIWNGAWIFLVFSLAAAEKPLPRKILAFYNPGTIKGEFKDIAVTQIHQSAEMPLNHLGMEVVYQDISQPLPNLKAMGDYHGMMTWFEQPVNFKDPAPFCRWLGGAMDAGFKVVVLGDMGLYTKFSKKVHEVSPECGQVLKKLGLILEKPRDVDVLHLQVRSKNSAMMEFERKIAVEEFVPLIPIVRPLSGATSYLKLDIQDSPTAASEPVAVSPAGGWAIYPFLLYLNKELKPPQMRWRLDPFAFFEAAYQLQGRPRPDTTTVNGRRLYFSHVDGDGFFNLSESDPRKWSGEIFLDEIFRKYPQSPFTASVIMGYYDMPRFSGLASLELTRQIMKLPNVEPASHGYAHPLIWHKKTVALEIFGYRFDAKKEIAGSLDGLNGRFAPASKRASLFLWTGNALPSQSELSLADQDGLWNMNGGGTRFDRYYDSYTYVAPLGRRLGGVRQVYAPASNENDYTNLWEGPYYGYRDVVETFEKTESPRRIKPVNIYIHYYSAEKLASLKVLQDVYAWAFRRPLFPIFAGEFPKIVRSFFEMKMFRVSEGRYRFEGGSQIRTVRFDGERRVPDLRGSKGVIGFKRFQNNLYVFLDESENREVVLGASPASRPYLVESNFEISGWRGEAGSLRFLKRGWWKGEMLLGGLQAGGAYRVSAGNTELKLKADAAGNLEVYFPGSERGGPAVEVRVDRIN